MRILLAVLLSFIPFSVHAKYLGELSANPYAPDSTANPFGAGSPFKLDGINNPYGRYGILNRQSRLMICMAREIPIDRTFPPIRMAQADASKGDNLLVWS